MRALILLAVALMFISAGNAWPQTRLSATTPVQKPTLTSTTTQMQRTALATTQTHPGNLVATVTLADIGFVNGFRFANLGGRREVFVPLPQGKEVTSSELVLVIDDISAHEARRNLEVLVNDRSAMAIALDGKSQARTIRVPIAKAKDGFIKLSFIYSGAATPDRCIDVRYVGDSLTIRPETAIEIDVGAANPLDVTTTVALMPRDVAIVLPSRPLAESEIATALTVGRTLITSGRRIRFQQSFESLPELAKRSDPKRWTRGIVVIGTLDEVSGYIDAPVAPVATVAGPPTVGTLAAVRIGGAPALIVSDAVAGRLLASPWLKATRGVAAASVGDAAPTQLNTDHVTFDQLGVAAVQAEVFGRADLATAIDMRRLPMGMRASRLLLDLMVAPDGDGEKAVVSVFVNEHMLGSTVAAINEPTHLDLLIPDGLIGTTANVRAMVQRRSAQGDCRFEPQGYPAQILGSSAFIITPADNRADDFSDLATRWSSGIEVLLPSSAAERPTQMVGLVSGVLASLSHESAPVTVKLTAPGAAPAPTASFLAVSELPPMGSSPRVRFDRGRIVVADRSGKTLFDLSGHSSGALAQVVTAGSNSGLWIRSFAANGALPEPTDVKLDQGDVAFVDGIGVALTMSTERDTLVRVSYPEQVSWLTVAERLRFWIVAGLWLFATMIVLFALQRMFRRKPAGANE